LVAMEHGSRRLLHMNVTRHPTSAWTLQQLREAIGYETNYQYLLHDLNTIFAWSLDESIANLGLRVVKSPPRSPRANGICERAIATIRRECLDWLIPISESHLRSIVKIWGKHYNRGRPHMSLEAGCPRSTRGAAVGFASELASSSWRARYGAREIDPRWATS